MEFSRTRAIPRRKSVYPHDVYILHRNAIKAQLEIRKLRKRDYNKVKYFVSSISNCTNVIDALTKSLYGARSKLKTFVMVNMSVIVGVVILQTEMNKQCYFERFHCSKYIDISSHRYNTCGMIEFCIVSPIFQKYVQFFLREIHRLTDISILFYKLTRSEIYQRTRTKPLAAILKDMLPVPDRLPPNFTHMQLNDIEVPNCYLEPKNEKFALFISSRRLCSLPRYDVNSRIVVVGASRTGFCFLESLIFCYDGSKHVSFNNLCLIYDRTLQKAHESIGKHISHMFVYRGKYNANHVNAICFHAHVNYVNGFMTSINRKFKYITVNKENIIPYDYLFLTCGKQYHQPIDRGVRKGKLSEPCPNNVFVINKLRDVEKAFEKILTHMKYKPNPVIVVYGSDLNTYCCLSALEKLNLSISNIKFVEPTPDEYERPYIDPFNNPQIFDTFHDILFLVGIDVYIGYYFYAWEVDPIDNMVVTVKYQSRKGAISFNCDFIFHYANKKVNYDTFTAVNSAGLVYDGKLVIGPDCRTNDPCIFAAGPMTKYSRRYYADKFVHKYYNSYEIGERLGQQIIAMLVPGGLEQNKGDDILHNHKNENTNMLVPLFIEPLVENCMLPGGIYFLNIYAPGKPVPIETQRHIAYIFETGNLKNIELDEDPEYFRLELNQQMKVVKIVCFTRKEIDVINYQRLWGKHEQALNNLVVRFKKGLITDFYQYFQTPFFCALYTDTFVDLQTNLENILTLLTTKMGRSVIEDVVSQLSHNNWKKLNKGQQNVITKKFLCSEYHKKMVEQIMKYLGMYVDYLPMYAHPLITKLILHNVELSPLFRKKKTQIKL